MDQVFAPYFTTRESREQDSALLLLKELFLTIMDLIWFETEKGVGSTFFIDLPFEDRDYEYRILIVDDEENIREVLSGILEDEGYDVVDSCKRRTRGAVKSIRKMEIMIS